MDLSQYYNILYTPFHFMILVLGVFLLIQLYYLLFVYGKLAFHKVESDRKAHNQLPISIIIYGHNDGELLKTSLPLIFQQEYPIFEVIVINDYSNDETGWILQHFQREYPALKIVEITEHVQFKHNKKFAITLGIKASQYEHLVFTNANCSPYSAHWLSEMAGAFGVDKEIVLGYSPYTKTRGLFNKIMRFEATQTAMQYLSYGLKRKVYRGIGRNLAYTKSLFFKGRGFASHMHIKAGADDLFVNQHANKHNVAIAIHPDSHLFATTKWKDYNQQKKEQARTSHLYQKKHQFMLWRQSTSNLLFYLAGIACLAAYPDMWHFVVGAYLIRLFVQILIFQKIYKKLRVPDLIWWLPFLDVYSFFGQFFGLFFRRKKSKGQSTD